MNEIVISLGSHQTTDNLAEDGKTVGKAFSDGKQLK